MYYPSEIVKGAYFALYGIELFHGVTKPDFSFLLNFDKMLNDDFMELSREPAKLIIRINLSGCRSTTGNYRAVILGNFARVKSTSEKTGWSLQKWMMPGEIKSGWPDLKIITFRRLSGKIALHLQYKPAVLR